MKVRNVAFYRFLPVADRLGVNRAIWTEFLEPNQQNPAWKFYFEDLRAQVRRILLALDIKGSAILSPEGVNIFLAGPAGDLEAACLRIREIPELAGLQDEDFKWSDSETNPFERLKVKLKREIIPMRRLDVHPELETAPRLDPSTLKQWLDQKKRVVLVDTRNDYETAKGTFEGALDWGLKNFQQFPGELEKRTEELSKIAGEAPIVMFCTGGIRCEKATALAQNLGLKNVFQLEGGILRYFEKAGSDHYTGSCFVFDERVALDSELHAI
ncbi:MAG: hypothetical protein JNL01_04655 [Bdellovibrionales bacterium]|nr:hypothetical protein [Bdellovibrionales bacterium]